jgi:hypothetical protein
MRETSAHDTEKTQCASRHLRDFIPRLKRTSWQGLENRKSHDESMRSSWCYRWKTPGGLRAACHSQPALGADMPSAAPPVRRMGDQ